MKWLIAIGVVIVFVFSSAELQSDAAPTCVHRKESRLFALINQTRENHGLRPYGWWTCTRIRGARAHSLDMAVQKELYHYAFPLPDNWEDWGQNVGMDVRIRHLHRELMHEPGHRANILDPEFRRVAIGVVHYNGLYWATENFVNP
jgi:uncharacterized protein YkwD